MIDGRWLRSDTGSRGSERGDEHEPFDPYAHPKRGHYLTSVAVGTHSFSVSATVPLSSSRPPLPHQSGAGSRSGSTISNGHPADNPYSYDVKGRSASSLSASTLYTTVPIMPTPKDRTTALSTMTYRTTREAQPPLPASSRATAAVTPGLLASNTAYRHNGGPNPNNRLRAHEAALSTAPLPSRVAPSSSSLCDWDRLQRYVSATRFKDPSRYPYLLPNSAHHGGGLGLAPELGDTEDLLAVHADVLRFGKDCDPNSLEAQSNIPCPPPCPPLPPPFVDPEYRDDEREDLYKYRQRGVVTSQSVRSSVMSNNSAVKNSNQSAAMPSKSRSRGVVVGGGVGAYQNKAGDDDDDDNNDGLLLHSEEGSMQQDQRYRVDRREVQGHKRWGGRGVNAAGSMTEAGASRYHTNGDAVASRAVKAAARTVAAAVVSTTTTPSPSPAPVGQTTSLGGDRYHNNNNDRKEGEERAREGDSTVLHERRERPEGNMGRRQSFSERGGDEESTRPFVHALPRTTEAKLQEQYEALKREYEDLKARGTQGQGHHGHHSGGARAGTAGMGMGRADTLTSSDPREGRAVREAKDERASAASAEHFTTSKEESARSATTTTNADSSSISGRGALTRTGSGGKKTRVYTVGGGGGANNNTSSSRGPSPVKAGGYATGSRSIAGMATPEEARADAPYSAVKLSTVVSGSSLPEEASVSSATRHLQRDSFSAPYRVDPTARTSHSSFSHDGEKEKRDQEERYGHDYSHMATSTAAAADDGDSNYYHHFKKKEDLHEGERRLDTHKRHSDGPLTTPTAAMMHHPVGGASPSPSGAPETTITTVSTAEQPLILDIVLGGEAYAIPVYNGDRVDRVMETFQQMRGERWRAKQGGEGGDFPPPLTDRQWKRLELTISAACGSSSYN